MAANTAIIEVVGRVRQVGRSSGCYLTAEMLMQAPICRIWGKALIRRVLLAGTTVLIRLQEREYLLLNAQRDSHTIITEYCNEEHILCL